jgi:vacuolar-type H+-ATPase subunit C/Vma6
LTGISRLSELDRLVFADEARELPERELLIDLEARFMGRFLASVKSVLDSFRKTPRFYTLLLQGYEDSARKKTGDDIDMQTADDKRYYEHLWKALGELSAKDQKNTRYILSEEVQLRNAAWALRLRTYYGLRGDAVRDYLVDMPSSANGAGASLASDAMASLGLPLDSRVGWDGWKRASFLNPDDGSWKLDPRYFQNAASHYLYRLARYRFRASPSSLDVIFCFIKIKQFEEDALTSVAEGLGLGMSAREVFSMLGVL